MGVVQLPDELQRVIERQAAVGRAASPAAFLEEAIMRLVEEAGAEDDELGRVVEAGSADIDAGRFTSVATPEDRRRLQDGTMRHGRERGRKSRYFGHDRQLRS